MGRFFKRQPSPALAISIAALIVALSGSAIAGVATISKLSKSEKRKVRRIADQQIAVKAPGLSVRSAVTAGTASSAASANTAVTATVAGDVSNQMWAVVSGDDASVVRSTVGITGASRVQPSGLFQVTTNRDLTNCFYMATLGGTPPGATPDGQVAVNRSSTNPAAVLVATNNGSGSPADRNFTLLIRC